MEFLPIDCSSRPPNATDIPAGETTESAETQELVDVPLPSSFVSRYIPVAVDPNRSSRAAFQGLIAVISQEENQVTDNEVPTQVPIDFQGNRPPPPGITVDGSSPHAGDSVRVSREATPYNEFEENDLLLYSSFPFLFNFGKGLFSSGSVELRPSYTSAVCWPI
jgi:hypothetical protein